MCLSLVKLDLKGAFYYNPFLLLTSPIILFLLIYPEVRYVKYGKYELRKAKYLLYAEIFGLVVFGILRNVV